jgi:hypothetical protein
MHLLKYNPDAKTLTEVPPSEFDPHPLTPCRYFYVLGNRAHVPIVTPDGIGEIVWQHPDYQPPSPANTMTEQHRADPKLWAAAEKWGANTMDMANCTLELRDRVEALEATQHAHIKAGAAGVEATEAGVRYAIEQLRSKPGRWQPQDKLGRLIEQDRSDPRQLMLVERVADAIGAADDEGLTNMTWSYHSRAAIRAVAEWLRSEYPQREGCGTAWANLIDNEANR